MPHPSSARRKISENNRIYAKKLNNRTENLRTKNSLSSFLPERLYITLSYCEAIKRKNAVNVSKDSVSDFAENSLCSGINGTVHTCFAYTVVRQYVRGGEYCYFFKNMRVGQNLRPVSCERAAA